MAKRWTGRRVIGAAVVLVIAGAIGGTVAMRILKKLNDAPGGKGADVVVLEFTPADLARVDAQPHVPLAPGVGHGAAAAAGDGQGQGVGRRARSPGPGGRGRALGAVAGAHRHGRPRGKADRAERRARVGEGPARDGRQDAGDEPAAPQAELHLAERVRQFRIEPRRVAGQRQVGGSPGAARPQRAARRDRHVPARRASWRSATFRWARRWRSIRRSSPSST